jgi:hypothetical protein
MPYSDSSHFFDKLSYKILCISSYRIKDMIYARLAHLQQFFRKQRRAGDYSHQGSN